MECGSAVEEAHVKDSGDLVAIELPDDLETTFSLSDTRSPSLNMGVGEYGLPSPFPFWILLPYTSRVESAHSPWLLRAEAAP